jgi:methyl-accepting chemotaxis protein
VRLLLDPGRAILADRTWIVVRRAAAAGLHIVGDNVSKLEASQMTIPRRRSGGVPLGRQVVFGLTTLVALTAVSVAVAMALIVGQRIDESGLGERDVPYADAIAQAALDAKGVANDQRGFLLTGDPQYIAEADGRVDSARTALSTALRNAADERHREAVTRAKTGFELWVGAVRAEFDTYQAGDRKGAITTSLGADRQMRKAYEDDLAAAQQLAQQSIAAAQATVQASASRSLWILGCVLTAALILGGVIATWLLQRIARPLFRLLDVLRPELS